MALALVMISYTFGWSLEIVVLLAVCAFLAVLFVRASLATFRECDGHISIDHDESSFAAKQ